MGDRAGVGCRTSKPLPRGRKINQWFREKDRAGALELGKQLLTAELRSSYLNARDYLNSPKLRDVAKQLKLEILKNFSSELAMVMNLRLRSLIY